MINWLSNKIVRYFRDNAISKINAEPTAVAREYFSKQIDFLNQKYDGMQECYWIGSFMYKRNIIEYFQKYDILTSEILIHLPFERSTEDDNIIDIIIGKTQLNQWVIAFFSDNIDLYTASKFVDSIFIKIDSSAYIELKNYTSLT